MGKEQLVRDIYHKGVILCKPDTLLQEVVRVMADTEIHAVMVAEREGDPDLINKIADERNATTVDELLAWMEEHNHPALLMPETPLPTLCAT